MTRETFTHIDEKGRARMVDVGGKQATLREATASARIRLGEKVFGLVFGGEIPKGDVLAVSRVAGIMAAKKVDSLIPLCHSLPLHAVEIIFEPDPGSWSVRIIATARTKGVTGVEMEAMTAVSVAALAFYDMCKSVEKGIVIESIRLEYKSGGKSGIWQRQPEGE